MLPLLRRFVLFVRLARLASGTRARCVLAAWSLYATARVAAPILPAWFMRVPVQFPNAVSVIEFRERSDLWELKDVLLDKEYEALDLASPEVLIELGSNIGISTVYLATAYPGARILAVEPNPNLARQLSFNASSHPNIELHAFALAERDGIVSFYIGESSLGSSFEQKAGNKRVEVEGVAADSLLRRLGVGHADLIKFDIEGAEQYLLRGFSGFENVRAYLGEVHYDRMPVTRGEITERFKNYKLSSYPAGRPDREILYLLKA